MVNYFHAHGCSETIAPGGCNSPQYEARRNHSVHSERPHSILRREIAEDISVVEQTHKQLEVYENMCGNMNRIVLLSLVSLAAATPVIVNQEEPFSTMQLYAHFAIDRSDQDISGTSGYGGGYGGGDYGGHGGSGYDASSGGHLESSGGYDGGHQDFSSGGGDFGGHGGDDGGHGISLDAGQNYVHSVPVSEHVEVTKPVAIPVYKHIGVPVPKSVPIAVPHPVAVGVPQPYPVHVPVPKHFPIQVVKTIAIPVEKKVPYPVEKHIPVPVEKPVPITIEKHIPVPVVKPYPIKIPVYKTIYHHAKKH